MHHYSCWMNCFYRSLKHFEASPRVKHVKVARKEIYGLIQNLVQLGCALMRAVKWDFGVRCSLVEFKYDH